MTMQDENWSDPKTEDLDLQLENQSLEEEIKLKGGLLHKGEDTDPNTHNSFLRRVLAFEEADKLPMIPMRSLFPKDFELPPATKLSNDEVANKLERIAAILAQNHVYFGFVADLPNEVLYEYLRTDCIPNHELSPTIGMGYNCTLDGCGGACDDCFQFPYCSTGKELMADQEKDAPDTPAF